MCLNPTNLFQKKKWCAENQKSKSKNQNPKITKYIRVRFFDQKRRRKKGRKKNKQTIKVSFFEKHTLTPGPIIFENVPTDKILGSLTSSS